MRFGIIGTNFISDEFVRAGQTVEGCEPFAVCSRTKERGKAFAEKHGIRRAVSSLEELAAMEEIDAVYIATPNACHAAQAERMLSAGKSVLVEKPAVPSAAAFSRLLTLAEEKGVVLMEGMRSVHTPGFHALAQLLERIAPVRRVSISYCQYSRRYDHFREGIVENAFDPALCNGALMDIGAYSVGELSALFGMPQKVLSAGWKLRNGLDAMGEIVCVYDGMLADLSYGKISDTRRASEIQGEQGTILFYPPTNPSTVELIPRGGERRTIYSDPSADFFGMRYEIVDFLSFARDPRGEGWKRYARYTLDALRIMDAVRSEQGIDFRRQGDTNP